MKRLVTGCFVGCLLLAGGARAQSVYPEIVSFQSRERITHQAPGGPNAAREIEVEVGLFDEAGRMVALPGYTVNLVAFDGDAQQRYGIGTLKGMTDSAGRFKGKVLLSNCRTPAILGPTRVHRISNRPEYWDVTYTAARVVANDNGNGQARFVHVCKEIYRGTRP